MLLDADVVVEDKREADKEAEVVLSWEDMRAAREAEVNANSPPQWLGLGLSVFGDGLSVCACCFISQGKAAMERARERDRQEVKWLSSASHATGPDSFFSFSARRKEAEKSCC